MIMGLIRSVVILIFFLVVFSSVQNIKLSMGTSVAGCNGRERKALLTFKQDLNDSFNYLSDWDAAGNKDCCKWTGVVCNNKTGVVHELHLQVLSLSGELNPSLLELKHLNYLDLSSNNFNISIPPFLGSLQYLRYLNLADGYFVGMIPPQLGNLTNLRYLSMSTTSNFIWGVDNLYSGDDLEWFSHLSSLQYLDMSSVKLSKASSNWLHSIHELPSLLELHLSFCDLRSIPSLSYVNFTSLTILDLSGNNFFNTYLPEWLYTLTSLVELYLTQCHFEKTISEAVGNLSSLTTLRLGTNELEGELPSTLGNLSNLMDLDLCGNKLQGEIPDQLGRLKNLGSLSLCMNSFSGSIPSSLGRLSLLQSLELSNNNLTGSLPESFRYLSNLRQLRISDNTLSSIGISGTVPTWFCNMSSQFTYLDLSHNHLSGELPYLLAPAPSHSNFNSIFLNSNRFKGRLPIISPDIGELDLSNNSFSGPISVLLCNPLNKDGNRLSALDISGNLLSGKLPQCWFYWNMEMIRLENNNITGKIPSSMGSLSGLHSLHLRNNSLSGEVPSSLRNCNELTTIDLGENAFTGSIPTWMGESLPKLISLSLRQNKFYGGIPQELCHLTSLRLLDLAHNHLSGSIPRCFNNFTTMASKQESKLGKYYHIELRDTAPLVTKGRPIEYGEPLLVLATSMDLSNNNLSGEIPKELTSLFELQSLNLSENHFTGKIPEKIGRMHSLESLDFSKNELSSVIPQSMKDLTFLGNLNLSYNNLSGKIPSSTQLQGFDESSYMGNQGLCGPPLKNCNKDEQPQPRGDGVTATKEDEDESWLEKNCFYISLTLGFVIAFWGFWGVLLVNKSWRFAYFRFLDDTWDKFCNYCIR